MALTNPSKQRPGDRSGGSATVQLVRATHRAEDERNPLLLNLSRVPRVGEHVSITNATRDGEVSNLGGIFVVKGVLHMQDRNVQARLNLDRVP